MLDISKIQNKTLIACSGGIDSLSLLIYLKKQNFNISALHINHEVQREKSTQMADELKNICSQYNINFYEVKIGNKLNKFTQAEMRKARYEALIQFAKENHYKQICLGHTQDDQIENFLMRLFRGSGIAGLSSMHNYFSIDDIEFIRPLIHTPKSILQNYLIELKINWIEDLSNFETKYFRNKVRLEVLPFLKKYNKDIYNNINIVQKNLSETKSFIDHYIRQYLHKNLVIENDNHYIIKDLYQEHEFIQNEIINQVANKISKVNSRINISNGFYGEIGKIYFIFKDDLSMKIKAS